MALEFLLKKCDKKKNGDQANPLYRSGRKNSLAIRLKPLTINDLDHLGVSTTEIKCPFKVKNQRLRSEDSSISGTNGVDLGTRSVTRHARKS